MSLSIIGRVFYNFENKICNNLRIFIGKHEKTTEIMFLLIYFLLQGILVIRTNRIDISLIVVIFLLFLALERIFVHIWLDYERRELKKKEKIFRENYDKLKFISYKEILKLNEEIKLLKNKR